MTIDHNHADEVEALALEVEEIPRNPLPMVAHALREYAALLRGSHPRSCDWWEGGLCTCGIQAAIDLREDCCAPLVSALRALVASEENEWVRETAKEGLRVYLKRSDRAQS